MILAAEQLSKTYRRGGEAVVAVDDATFGLEAGSFTALVGPSGSGKSTILNLIAGFDSPDRGRLLFEGEDLATYRSEEWDYFRGTTIGFVFQQFNLIPILSALENVEIALYFSELAAPERRERARAALVAVGLADRMAHRPDQLSGGQQQRVAVARAVVSQPRLILADEPTANLDGRTAIDLIHLMYELSRSAGTAFLFATHDTRIIERADARLGLVDGRLVGQT